jgi:hypothetical protein
MKFTKKFDPRKNTETAKAIKPTYFGTTSEAAVVVRAVVVVVESKVVKFSAFILKICSIFF